MADFTGTYKFESDDGKFDEFLKAMGEFHKYNDEISKSMCVIVCYTSS